MSLQPIPNNRQLTVYRGAEAKPAETTPSDIEGVGASALGNTPTEPGATFPSTFTRQDQAQQKNAQRFRFSDLAGLVVPNPAAVGNTPAEPGTTSSTWTRHDPVLQKGAHKSLSSAMRFYVGQAVAIWGAAVQFLSKAWDSVTKGAEPKPAETTRPNSQRVQTSTLTSTSSTFTRYDQAPQKNAHSSLSGAMRFFKEQVVAISGAAVQSFAKAWDKFMQFFTNRK